MSSATRSARYLLKHTEPVLDGDFATAGATLIGNLADGSTTPEPTSEYDAYMGGKAEVSAEVEHEYRVIGPAEAVIADIKASKDANPPTEEYVFIVAHNKQSYTQVGPGVFTKAIPVGNKTDKQRAGIKTGFYAEGDTAEEIYKPTESAVTLPAAA